MEGFIGRSRGGNWCLNLPGIKSGKHSLAAEETAALMAGGGRTLTGGSSLSAGRERGEEYRFGWFFLGRGLVPLLGRKGSLRPSFIFLFSFLLFLF
jgi:hypothetical protein